MLTSPFVPLLFQGEEWGASTPFPYFADHQDAALAAAVRSGRLREFAAFGWSPDDVTDPEDPATFLAAKLRWEELGCEPHRRILAWHRALIDLRGREPDLADGRLARVEAVADDGGSTLVVRRGAVVVAANLGATTSIRLPGPSTLLLASRADDTVVEPDSVALGPDAVAVLRLARRAGDPS